MPSGQFPLLQEGSKIRSRTGRASVRMSTCRLVVFDGRQPG